MHVCACVSVYVCTSVALVYKHVACVWLCNVIRVLTVSHTVRGSNCDERDLQLAPLCLFCSGVSMALRCPSCMYVSAVSSHCASGFVLIAQGFTSAAYHICPNQATFQFGKPVTYTRCVAVYVRSRIVSSQSLHVAQGGGSSQTSDVPDLSNAPVKILYKPPGHY